jgi:hypothetical protein
MEELDLGWQIIEGQKNILIVAGHNFEHGRKGKIKYAEWGTGEMGRRLCGKYGFWGIISTKKQMDPNWYTESPFREEIKKIILKNNIQLVIDIHGSGMQNEELIYLRGNKKFKEKYKIETRNFVNNEQLTLAEEWDDKVAVVELEIREDGRIPTIDEVKYKEAEKIINDLMGKLNES